MAAKFPNLCDFGQTASQPAIQPATASVAILWHEHPVQWCYIINYTLLAIVGARCRLRGDNATLILNRIATPRSHILPSAVPWRNKRGRCVEGDDTEVYDIGLHATVRYLCVVFFSVTVFFFFHSINSLSTCRNMLGRTKTRTFSYYRDNATCFTTNIIIYSPEGKM
jgi:hypothetical protein